jgi:hypothetical protein
MSYFEREAPVHYYTTYGLNSEEKYRKVAAYIKENFHGEGVAFYFYIKLHSYYVDVPLFEWRSREPDYCQGEGYWHQCGKTPLIFVNTVPNTNRRQAALSAM